ncbi:MAG: hypothetical protein ACR2MY_08020 [Candidatus Dormibacteria bacterium]
MGAGDDPAIDIGSARKQSSPVDWWELSRWSAWALKTFPRDPARRNAALDAALQARAAGYSRRDARARARRALPGDGPGFRGVATDLDPAPRSAPQEIYSPPPAPPLET